MELQFPKTALPCLLRVKSEMQTQEETQELRMPEEMPDVGRILGAWGQILLRSKEWRSDCMLLSGGVMTWVLYLPEGREDEPQTVEAWIPFQMKWDLPQTPRDGRIRVSPLLRSVDARSTSARKMMVRATFSMLAEAYVSDEVPVCSPGELPEDIHLRRQTYPLMLSREMGEKPFALEEELTLPASCPKIKRLVRFALHPELIDHKVLSGKVVFRGAAILHVLYIDPSNQLQAWDFELPFSQYADLDTQYEQEAQARVFPALTSLELDADTEDRLRLKAGLTGQYIIYDRSMVDVAQDAYSTLRPVQPNMEELVLPAVLEEKRQTVSAEQTVPLSAMRVADVAFYPHGPLQQRSGEEMRTELSGLFQMLYYDDQGHLQSSSCKWNGGWMLPMAENAQLELTVMPSGIPKGDIMGTEAQLRGDMLLNGIITGAEGIPMITMLEAGEEQMPDPNRPSLILRKMGSHTLWDLAKESGSTVEAIRQANRLDAEPDAERMLLIPVS